MAGFVVNNAFLTEFDAVFHEMLKYQGGTLIAGTMQEEVIGGSKYIRQTTVGDAHFIRGSGSPTEYATQKFDRRKLEPKDFACPIMLDDIDLRMMGTPNVDQYAQQAANSCGKMIDQIIITGLGGKSYSEAAGGEVDLPSKPATATTAQGAFPSNYDGTQVIAWADYSIGDNANGHTSLAVKAGLNSAKIAKAVMKLRSKFNYGPIVCVGSEYAMMTMRADPKVANSLFNHQQTLADGFITAYGGVDAYVSCQLVDSGKSHLKADGTISGAADGVDVEYAYVYSVPQIKLGVGSPLYLKNGLNAERYLNNVLIYQGAYACTRMFEESVVRIEIARTPPASTTDFLKNWNY